MMDWNLDYELVQTLSPVSSFCQDILSQQQEMKSRQLLRQTSLRYKAKANWSFRDICGCMISGAIPSSIKNELKRRKQPDQEHTVHKELMLVLVLSRLFAEQPNQNFLLPRLAFTGACFYLLCLVW